MINKSELMTFAWTIAKQDLWSRRLPQSDLTKIFPSALRSAWAELKRRAAIAAKRATQAPRPAADLWAEIQNLENTDTLCHAGMAKLSELKAAYSEAKTREDEEAAKTAMEAKRDLIASAKGQFCTVTFIKKDGSERQVRVQPAKLKFLTKGDLASESAQRAAETRAQRHPNLLPVWDTDKAAPHLVNLATVSRIAVAGQVHIFA